MSKVSLPPYLPGHAGLRLGRIWFASDLRAASDVRGLKHNDTIRHGDFVVRVISYFDDPMTGDTLIIGVQESYMTPYNTKFKDRIIWGPKGISKSTDEYRDSVFVGRK
jgi:hypothetical protein